MKKYYTIFLSAVLLVLYSCSKENTDPQQKDGGFIITDNQSELSSRIVQRNTDLAIETLNNLKSANSSALKLKLIAEVLSPVFVMDTLQATNVKFYDDYALVSYNTQGSKYLGGLELFNLEDIENPKLEWSAVFPGADYNALAYYDTKVYLVGAQNLNLNFLGLNSPSFMQVVNVDTIMKIASIDTVLDLGSYAATDVKAEMDRIYTTSGSTGFFKAFDGAYNQLYSEMLDDARSVAFNKDYIAVLQGTPGRLTQYNKSDFSMVKEILLGDANIPESKSEMLLTEDEMVAALNDGGIQARNMQGDSIWGIARPEIPEGKIPENYVSNSVANDGKYYYIANGAAGIHIAKVVSNIPEILGKIQFEDRASTNFVATNGCVMFVATGKGGLKIVKVTR